MVSRATHYRNKARHAQREFGQVKPRLLDRDEGTAWQGSFISNVLNGVTGEFNVHSPIAEALSDDLKERENKLRELCKLGVLHMRAHREGNVFIEYRWTVTQGE